MFIEYTSPWTGFELTTSVVIGVYWLIDDTTTQKKIDKTTHDDLPNIKQTTNDRPTQTEKNRGE
jgi:ascorbate-specific PTS system EIIC-type component UlaA